MSNNSTRILKNTLFLYFRMLLVLGVSLYTSRVVIDKLGASDFGIYNVVGGLVASFSFISGTMIESTQRYLNFEIGKKNEEGARRVMNASRVIHLGIAIVLLIFGEAAGSYILNNWLIIPGERLGVAFWVYQLSLLTSVFLIFSFPYNALIIAHERMKAFAMVSVFEALVKLSIAYLLSIGSFDRLLFYAVLMAGLQICVSLLYRFYCYKNFGETKFAIRNIGSDLYKSMLSFSGWNFLGSVANICLNQGTTVLLNMFFGPVVNAAKGVSIQVSNAVNQLCNNFQMAAKPQIVKSYAEGDYSYMHSLIFRTSKISYLLTLMLSLPIIFKTDFILSIWLKKVPEYTSEFIQYTLYFALVQSLAAPLFTGSSATGNVKRIMSVVATFFMMVIPTSFVFLKLGAPPIRVFQIQLIFASVAHVLRLFIVSSQINMKKLIYIKEVVLPIFIVTLGSFAFAFVVKDVFMETMMNSIVYWFAIECVFFVMGFVFGFSKDEKTFIVATIKNRLGRFA